MDQQSIFVHGFLSVHLSPLEIQLPPPKQLRQLLGLRLHAARRQATMPILGPHFKLKFGSVNPYLDVDY